MDLTQLSQMVMWLDEEHRNDREELAKIDQRLQGMMAENQQQARRIQELEGRLASTTAQLTRFTQLEQAIQQLKNEVGLMLDKYTEARLQSERETERARLSDREGMARSIAEIRKELLRLGPIDEELRNRLAEDRRLGEMMLALRQSLANISKDLDERTRSMPYMVEQRAQDNKRLAQIQAENVELLKRTEAQASKASLHDEWIQRQDGELKRIQPMWDQLRREQQTFFEAQKVADAERARQMVQWSEEFAQQEDLIGQQTTLLRDFTARYEAAGRALKVLEDFQVQIARDQKQGAELQRLSEERQRKELAEWQAENEQRWKKELLRWDYVGQEQQKVNQKNSDRFVPIERAVAHLYKDLEALWRLQELLGDRRLGDAQRTLDAVGAALDGRPKPGA
jgi:hypothetical protein